MSDEKRSCGHGPNECDPRNPDCLADIIASQNRRLARVRDMAIRNLGWECRLCGYQWDAPAEPLHDSNCPLSARWGAPSR